MNELKIFLNEINADYEEIKCIDGKRIDIEVKYNKNWDTEKFNKILKNKKLKYRLELGRIVVTD
ncbi:MAG: hypothetical protein ACLFPJ_06385 [Candidatus Woesearchaeota archaeon]